MDGAHHHRDREEEQGPADELLREAFGPASSLIPAERLADVLRVRGRSWTQVCLQDAAGEGSVDPPAGRREVDYGDELAGRYHVFGELARGGMGVVLRGRDRVLGRDVAIKVLRREHLDSHEAQDRFFEEAQVGAQLQHPGVVPVHEVGLVDESVPFFTMKLVRGETLAQLLRARTHDADDRSRFIDIFEQICQAVAYAHARGVIHRDLKPSNVMIGSYGEVQVMDWGLAKVMDRGGIADDRARPKEASIPVATVRSEDEGTNSRAGSVFGTPAYMAPEQARGDIEAMDERTDVFALGSVLCEVLTGAPAFAPHDEALAQARACATESALGRLDECGADPELVGLAMDCLQAAPSARPRNAKAIRERLARYATKRDARAERAKLELEAERVRAAGAKRAQRLTLALAASTLLTLAAVGGTWFWQRSRAAEHQEFVRARAEESLRAADVMIGRAVAGDPLLAPVIYADALRETEQAHALIADDGFEDRGFRSQVEERLERVRSSHERSVVDAERIRMHNALLATLGEHRVVEGPELLAGQWRLDWARCTEQRNQAAFASAGVDVDAADPKGAADVLRGAHSGAFAVALDLWALQRRELVDHGEMEREQIAVLTRLAAELDAGDPLRDRLRLELARSSFEANGARLEALAADAKPEAQAAVSMVMLGRMLEQAGSKANIELWERSRVHHAGDSWLHLFLGHAYEGAAPRRLEAAKGCYLAAYALNPNVGLAIRVAGICFAQGDSPAFQRWAKRAASLAPDAAHAQYVLAMALVQAGELDDADRALSKVLELDSSFGAAYSIRASILQQQRRTESFAEQLRLLHRAAELSPGVAWIQNNLGQAYRGVANWERAALHFAEAARISPQDPLAWRRLAQCRRMSGDLRGALEAYRTLLSVSPDEAAAENGIGICLGGLGDPDGAVDAFERAIKIDETFALAINNLGAAMVRRGELERARALFQREKALTPTSPSGYDYLALLDVIDGKSEAADIEFARIAETHPRRWRNRDFLAALAVLAASSKAGEVRDWGPETRRALRDHALRWLRGNLEWLSEPLTEVAVADDSASRARIRSVVMRGQRLKRWHRLSSVREPDALRELPDAERPAWQAFWRDVDAAISKAQRMLRDPETAERHHAKALEMRADGRLFDALDHHRQAVELDADRVEYARELGGTLIGLGLFDQALAELERALAHGSEDLRTLDLLGDAHAKRGGDGGDEAAVACWERALSIDPSTHSVRCKLAVRRALSRSDEVRDAEQAVADARRALADGAAPSEGQAALGVALFSAGEMAQAQERLLASLKAGNRAGLVRLLHGISLARLGRRDEARSALSSFRRSSPGEDATGELASLLEEARQLLRGASADSR